MEPVTHILTGACIARTGFNRRAAYATLTMVVAAEFPDIDTLWSLRGPVEGFTHHRGMTHTFLGLPFEAALIVGGVYLFHRWRQRLAGKAGTSRQRPLTLAPVRWGALYGFALIALLSHLLLDYTNNYGLRPFFPFNDHWYAASIVFIFDPLIFALLAGALVLPLLFGLVGSEVGARRKAFRGRGWAIAALLGVAGWWTLRAVEHEKAIQMAMAQSIAEPAQSVAEPQAASNADAAPASLPIYLQSQRALASPGPLSPFQWSAVTDFGPVYQLSEIDTRNVTLQAADSFESKPLRSPAIVAAERSSLGRAYLDWSPMPFVGAVETAAPGDTTVTFRDPRFLGGWLEEHGRPALGGSVVVDARGRVVRQVLDGRIER